MIAEMRDLTDDDKLSFRSLPEVVEWINGQAGKLRSDKAIRFRRQGKPKAPPRHAIATAVFLRVMAMSADDQRAFIAAGMDRLNALLSEPDGVDGLGVSSPEAITPRVERSPEPPRKAAHRGKKNSG